jgi:hypothetical protein
VRRKACLYMDLERDVVTQFRRGKWEGESQTRIRRKGGRKSGKKRCLNHVSFIFCICVSLCCVWFVKNWFQDRVGKRRIAWFLRAHNFSG